MKHGTVIVQGVGTTDNSPPEHIPHEEYSGVERAKARILLPDAVKRLNVQDSNLRNELAESRAKVENVISTIETLVSEQQTVNKLIERLVGNLDRLLNIETTAKTQTTEANQVCQVMIIFLGIDSLLLILAVKNRSDFWEHFFGVFCMDFPHAL